MLLGVNLYKRKKIKFFSGYPKLDSEKNLMICRPPTKMFNNGLINRQLKFNERMMETSNPTDAVGLLADRYVSVKVLSHRNRLAVSTYTKNRSII